MQPAQCCGPFHNLDPIDNKIHVFQHLSTPITKTFALPPKIGVIKQVLVQNRSLTLYLITEDGLLYRSNDNLLKLVPPFDGSSSMRVEQMAFYTEAILFVGRDDHQQYKIFGLGDNNYFRMTHFCESNTKYTTIQQAFDVTTQTIAYPDVIRKVTQIGCCYSFSCCVVNGIYVHMSGQNWVHGNPDLIGSYHCWSRLLQKMDVKVSKMECGDFHVVLLHEDGSISVGGRSIFSRVTLESASVPFSKMKMNFPKACNIFCGSNSILTVFENGSHKYFGSGNLLNIENEAIKITDQPEEKITEISHCPDYVICKLSSSAHKLYLNGRCYFDWEIVFDKNQILDLKTIISRNDFFNIRGTEENFYKEHVKYVALANAVIVYCSKSNLNMNKFMNNLLALNDTANPNNWSLFDISILHFD